MTLKQIFTFSSVTVLFAFAAAAALTKDDVKLLQDDGGWEYVTLSDQDAGIQTEHICFDGQPHPGQCSGTLTFRGDNTFTQQVNIHGKSVDRHGTYEISDDQIAFFDEFGTRDGPYTAQLNSETKMLVLSMPQVKIELELASQYRDDMENKKAPRR